VPHDDFPAGGRCLRVQMSGEGGICHMDTITSTYCTCPFFRRGNHIHTPVETVVITFPARSRRHLLKIIIIGCCNICRNSHFSNKNIFNNSTVTEIYKLNNVGSN